MLNSINKKRKKKNDDYGKEILIFIKFKTTKNQRIIKKKNNFIKCCIEINKRKRIFEYRTVEAQWENCYFSID